MSKSPTAGHHAVTAEQISINLQAGDGYRITYRRRADHGHRFAARPADHCQRQKRLDRAPVSSGQKGRETPSGIFSVIQKEAEHYSNLYDDAYMPHMQRITWSGIALHGGPLPGHPASHGCVRMPYDFAEHLFSATTLGMR
jgi:lipoprotein-anchoring transpeptidase ErfK/SrfK